MQIPPGQIVFAFFTLPHSFHSNFSAGAFPWVSPANSWHHISRCLHPRVVCCGLCAFLHSLYVTICQDARQPVCLSAPRFAAMVAVTVSLSAAALEPWLMIARGWQRCFSFSRTHSAHVDEREENEKTFNQLFSFPEIEQDPLFSRVLRGVNVLSTDLRCPASHVLHLLPDSNQDGVCWAVRRPVLRTLH